MRTYLRFCLPFFALSFSLFSLSFFSLFSLLFLSLLFNKRNTSYLRYLKASKNRKMTSFFKGLSALGHVEGKGTPENTFRGAGRLNRLSKEEKKQLYWKSVCSSSTCDRYPPIKIE